MHGLHHQQQQLAALLAAALPKEDSSSEDDSARVTAINSLHRAILHPHNALLVGHSSSFLSQGLFQLLSDKSYSVRQSAVIAYGSLCSIACSSQLASNGRPSSAITGGLAERFIGWALPQLRDVSVESGAAELALEGLREFLNSGDAVGIERFVLPILKSCQELLEDERTSLDQLRQLLGLLTLVSLKFSRCFQSHFVDIVDLLLGWALVPDLLESDRCIIMDSFVQFQKHWLGNLQFSLGLLSKFLGDMEVLLQDGTPGTPQQFRRLLALLSCFLTILQVTASGMLEMNMLEQINEPLAGMLPQLLASLTMVGRSFGWSKWIGESLRCLILLAEILHERFSTFYPMAVDILFQNLGVGNASLVHTLPTFQVHGVLKTNLQLLSLQKLSLLPASVKKILHFDSPLAHLRLHPNQLVTGSLAATYLYLLQHGSDGVVGQAIASLLEELELLRSILGKIRDYGYMVKLGDLRVANASDSGSDLDLVSGRSYSELELIALIKFDLKVLLSCVCLGTGGISLDQVEVISHYERSIKLTSFIIEKLNPFTFPIQCCVELQVHVVSVLCKLSEVEFLRKHTIAENSRKTACDGDNGECDGFIDFNKVLSVEIIEYLKKYTMYIVSALDASSPLTVKLEALEWIYSFCGAVITLSGDFRLTSYIYEPCGHGTISGNLLFSVLGAASDRELRVRSQVASILELLLQTGLIYPSFFCTIAEVALEKLGDSNLALKNAFVRVLSIVLPLTVYTYGSLEIDVSNACRQGGVRSGERFYWHWKQLFALKQLPQQLRPQQFVSILNYISHRWKVPLSSWIQRLVFGCHSNDKEFVSSRLEEREKISTDSLWKDLKIDANMLDKICSTNNLAAVWWSIHEAARHCITVRLRTHLGGPTQTFAALERLLFDIVHVLQLETEQSEGSVSIGSSGAHLLPMRLLLDFVEALKKNIYNAYDGSSVLPSASRQSSLFFRANKKVCEEWFARICEPMMNAGLALQCHTATLNYCALRLQDLRNIMTSALKETSRTQVAENLHNVRAKIGGDVLRVLRHASLALCRSHEPEALVGLQKWAVMAFSSLLVDDNQPMAGHRGNFGTFSWITGLVYQADGQYEKAAAHFSHLLQSEEALNSMGSDGVQFAIARVIESYAALSDWKSLEAWLLELQALRAKHAGKSYSGALTTAGNEINALYALARFDEGDFQASWGYLDLTPKSSNELTIGSKQALQRSEQMLLQAMLRKNGKVDQVAEEIEKAKLMLEEALSVVPLDGLTETASYAIQLHCIHAFEEGCKLHGHDGSGQVSTVLNSLHQVVQSPLNKIHQDCNLWLKVLRVYRAVQPNSPVTLHLCRQLISLARKQRNFMMAHCLHQYLMNHLMMLPKSKSTDWLIRNLQYESIKLMYKEDKREDALTSLWSLVRTSMLSLPTDTNDMLKAKACLKLASWLRQGSSDVNWENVLMICSNYHSCGASSFNPDGVFVSDSKFISDTSYGLLLEEIVGTATKISSLLCPTLGKSWLSYASWCYSQAKCSLSAHDSVLQSCSLSPILLPEVSPSRFRLNKEEISGVEAKIINFLKTNKDVKTSQTISGEVHLDNDTAVKALVQQVVCFIEAAAGAPGVESSDGESATCTLISQLQVAFHSVKAGIEQADILSLSHDLVDIWWSLRRRRVSLFGHAAHGYLQYLSQSTSKVQESPGAGPHLDFMKQMTGSCTLRATLYVLHILLNYGVELQDTLEPGLATVPLLPWQDIIPQLFARLSSHPEQVVRKQLEDLLMMLAKLSPWSIVYPTLVDINAYDGEPSEELQHILGCLVKLHPNLVRDVQLVINELGIVTVLWEEQWLSTLQDLHTDVLRRINLLKEEAARVSENVTLSQSEKTKINAAKYSAMMAPVAVALERRLASTSRKPETAHEIWFQKEYGEALKSAILTFKMPPASAAALGDVWRPFDVIAASLATHQRKQLISLSDVAPQLALLLSSDVPMPGLEKQISVSDSTGNQGSDLQGIITISSFCEQVTILSTKTKPKKLVILGSDGQKYTYLLKGREDLRLDARIMQLLQAINNFLYSCNDTNRRSLAIRYYSVTPISGRAGLIQWVDNVISIYSVFKHWQNRAQLAQVLAIGSGNVKNTVPPVPRPSDMFYGKIIPALKEKGIRRVISRRDWPHEVKRKVLLDLMKETPRQLLYQEIWCASEGFKAFSSKLKRFSGSVAAMSMVGHMLGLGDRHLDNILMDFSTGDVVHIDYNVCFDKGQRLKIPEIVPFRLTQTIETALGLTGIEGAFRANCEAVVGVLRKNKDIVLMLLEVFVWDPLIEWTRGDGHDEAAIGGEERKGMELAVSLSLFASRVQEIRVPLQEHHDLFLSTLPAAESSLEKFSDLLNQYEVVSALFYRADQERSTLILHETSAKSIAAEATCNSEKTRASFEVQAREFAQAKTVAIEKSKEAALWIEQHGRVLDALRSGSILEIKTLIELSGMEEALSLTAAVPVAGVPLTIVPEPTLAQCHDLDREVAQLIAELDSGLSCSVKALQAYSLELQRVLPLNYVTTSHVHGWAQVLQLAVNNLSSDVLALARRQASDLVAKAQADSVDSARQRHADLCFKVEQYIKEIKKVEEDCCEVMNSIESETEAKSKDRLLSAFTKFMHSSSHLRKEEDESAVLLSQNKYEKKDSNIVPVDLEEKKAKVLSMLRIVASALYKEVKDKVFEISSNATERIVWGHGEGSVHHSSKVGFCGLEEQIEKCVLVAGFVDELQHLIGFDLPKRGSDTGNVKHAVEGNWASVFQASILSCRSLIEQITGAVLSEIIKSFVSYNSEVMDAFGSLSQIRGSIDTALEQLVEVELERASLMELEQNYFVKVGLITEQQLALGEASVQGREHLSWEEAEELATQEEACRAQLDQLHQTWSQKDMHTSSLTRREANIRNTLISSKQQFLSLINVEHGGDLRVIRSKFLLATLAKPFNELESIDQMLSSLGTDASYSIGASFNLADFVTSGYSLSESIWKVARLLKNHSFFIWKIGIIDSFLDSCIHDISSSLDHNLGFDQVCNVLKMKLEFHLQEYVDRYMRERVAVVLLERLEKETEYLKRLTEEMKEFGSDYIRRDAGAVKRVQLMLEEYCNAHETARAARSAVSLMKKQVNELTQNLHKATLEAIQMEWLHDLSLPNLHRSSVISQYVLSDNNLSPVILNLDRSKLLENIRSGLSSIARSMECLQSYERTSVSAEGQLERAMVWACAGPNTSSTSNSLAKSLGIPPEFHGHIMKRRQLLWEAQEQAADVMKVCTSVLEFEASRDGIFRMPGEISPGRPTGDDRTWQQAYLNALTRLDVTYHSFARAEQEWKLAQSNMEAASSSLFSATNELCIASVKAKSASGDLQGTLASMRDCAYEASVALSAFGRVTRGHTALTSECGSMLEEVLAITEGIHDVYSLGKEAASVHGALMTDLTKVNSILLPLEPILASDVAAMADAMSRERESTSEIPPIHGQALYQSYCLRLREACQSLRSLVPSLMYSVKELHAMLTRLARSASIHAGNLHEALEGLGESQVGRSQEIVLSRSELVDHAVILDDKDKDLMQSSNGASGGEFTGINGFSQQYEEWISPPGSIYSSSPSSSITSTDEASLSDNSDSYANPTKQLFYGVSAGDTVDNSSPITSAQKSDFGEKLESQCSEAGTDGVDIASTSVASGEPLQASSFSNEATDRQANDFYNTEKDIHGEISSLVGKNEGATANEVKGQHESNGDPSPCMDPASWVARGKNAYALSVLRRVEMKLDGQDINDGRQLSISDQVDHLLRQATSIDNLCNMYEGWTPWI